MNLTDENSLKYKIKLGGNPHLVFNDYKKTGLYIPIGINCSGKCFKDSTPICHNWEFNNIYQNIDIEYVINEYIRNPFVECFILSGMEVFDNFNDVFNLIKEFRKQFQDDIVIYTGYYPEEIKEQIQELKEFTNIIIKFGRYIQDSKPIYSEVLGITLASENQFAKRIEYLT